ncbi:hypothetical protein B0H19DRAFT_877478, partial [Mycena capillaripes]
ALVGFLFGVIHCAAWNIDFPTTGEQWMWRSCSSFVTVLPLAWLPLLLHLQVEISGADETSMKYKIHTIIFLAVILIYMLARLFLIVLPLIALRSLPPGAFADVNWSAYIP